MHENQKGLSKLARNNQVYRMLRPRYLCFLRDPFADRNNGVDIREVDEWESSDGQDAKLEYLFVAYSTEHFNHSSEQDMMALHHIAETACRAAKLPAYWIACSCMRDESELEADVSIAMPVLEPLLTIKGISHLRRLARLAQHDHRSRQRQVSRFAKESKHRKASSAMGKPHVDLPRGSTQPSS